MESRFNEGPRDDNIEVLFHIFYHYWGKENRSLYRGLCSTKEKLAKWQARIALQFQLH